MAGGGSYEVYEEVLPGVGGQPERSSAELAGWQAPRLRGVLLRVVDVDAAERFFAEALGTPSSPGREDGWLAIEVGEDQVLELAPGGRELPVIADRNDQGGIIPILRLGDYRATSARLEEHGAAWIGTPKEYDMMGTARIGYISGPSNQPIGIQQRLDNSLREEDIAFSASARRVRGHGVAGIGWLLRQVADFALSREFYAVGLGWGERRRTPLGSMLAISPSCTLQTWQGGRQEDVDRDLEADSSLAILSGDATAITERVVAFGGRAGPRFHGRASVFDREGHCWLLE